MLFDHSSFQTQKFEVYSSPLFEKRKCFTQKVTRHNFTWSSLFTLRRTHFVYRKEDGGIIFLPPVIFTTICMYMKLHNQIPVNTSFRWTISWAISYKIISDTNNWFWLHLLDLFFSFPPFLSCVSCSSGVMVFFPRGKWTLPLAFR